MDTLMRKMFTCRSVSTRFVLLYTLSPSRLCAHALFFWGSAANVTPLKAVRAEVEQAQTH